MLVAHLPEGGLFFRRGVLGDFGRGRVGEADRQRPPRMRRAARLQAQRGLHEALPQHSRGRGSSRGSGALVHAVFSGGQIGSANPSGYSPASHHTPKPGGMSESVGKGERVLECGDEVCEVTALAWEAQPEARTPPPPGVDRKRRLRRLRRRTPKRAFDPSSAPARARASWSGE